MAKTLKNLLKSVNTLNSRLESDAKKLRKEITVLEKLGVVNGTIWMQEKRPGYKVAYLHHIGGREERVRQYIGVDAEKLKAAKASIARYPIRQDKLAQLAAVEYAIDELKRGIECSISDARYSSTTQRRLW